MQGNCTSRDALDAFTVLNALLWRQAADDAAVLSPRPIGRLYYVYTTFILRLYRSRYRAERSFKPRRALCAHGPQCPSWHQATVASMCSRRPHRTFTIGTTALAIVQGDRSSGDAHFALTVLDALHWRQAAAAAAAVLSPST